MGNYKKGRVNFKYETEVNGSKASVELPMRMLVMGDFAKGQSEEAKKSFDDRKVHNIQPGKLDDLIKKMGIELNLEVEDHLHEGSDVTSISVPIRGMADFKPENIANNNADLRQLLDLREQIQVIRDKANASPKRFGKILKQLGTELSGS